VIAADAIAAGRAGRTVSVREHLLYVGGSWRKGGGGIEEAVSPSSGESFATLAVAGPGDVDDAAGDQHGRAAVRDDRAAIRAAADRR
jgi:acyl-CoA reductase-like NAD-dependent aldehyde dehydrogenase